MKTISNYSVRLIPIILLVALNACESFLEIDPPRTEIVKERVFTSDASAFSAINGIYSLMARNTSFTNSGLEELTGVASDEMINYAQRVDQVQFANNTITSRNTDVLSVFWSEAYKYISNANGVLEGLSGATGMSAEALDQVRGEALFIRAFSHFYLAALFNDVPYLVTTDYKTNSVAPRLPVDQVYRKIAEDLLAAVALLPELYSSGERIRPNRDAAIALLARTYLYLGEWENAAVAATEVIDNTALYELVEPANTFLAGSREAIWQLKPVEPNANTAQARLFILTAAPDQFSRRVSLRDELVNSFDPDDDRRSTWIGSYTESATWYFAHKYKQFSSTPATEYNIVIRLAELYLVRAEARTQLDDFVGAAEDINTVRDRAGLDATPAADQDVLLEAVLNERLHEFFAEWGHRWLDLKRLGYIDEVMPDVKAGWESTDQWFPIPESERLLNPKLSQNPGY